MKQHILRNWLEDLFGSPAGASVSVDIAAVKNAVDVIETRQVITVTEQEAMVAGDICISTSGGFIPESSLTDIIFHALTDPAGTTHSAASSWSAVDWITNSIAMVVGELGVKGTITPIRLETNGDITIGGTFEFNGSAVSWCDITNVGRNGRFVLIFANGSTSGAVTAIAGEVATDTLSVRIGASDVLAAANSSNIAICEATTDKFFASWNETVATQGEIIAGTINTSTLAITKGSVVVEDSAGDINANTMCNVDTDKCAWVYKGPGNTLWTTICTVSSVTVTTGTAVDTGLALDPDLSATALTTSLLVICFGDTGSDSSSIAATISGTVPTFGSAVELEVGTQTQNQTVKINDTTVLHIWTDVGTSNKYIINTLSGNTITKGNVITFSSYVAMDVEATNGHSLPINDFGTIFWLQDTKFVILDIGLQDNNFDIWDVLGVAEDVAGSIIIDGIDEGNASGLDPRTTVYFDSANACVKTKQHGITWAGVPRVRILDTDALKAIGG